MKGESKKMGRFKFVSGEMPAARLDRWCQNTLNENAELELVSYTEVAAGQLGIRATFIFNDQFAEGADEPDVNLEGPENIFQTEGGIPPDPDLTKEDLENSSGC